GLISGLPTADLIAQLMALEARPMNLLQERVSVIQAQRTAFVELSARLLGLKSRVQPLDEPSFFRVFRSNSSDENVLTALAGENAGVGTFRFQVHSLVSNHALIGAGFADADTTPVGAGTLTLEMGHGLLNESTDLERLNGDEGVRRGRMEITDRAGNSVEIDLRTALNVADVLSEINTQTAINVRARVAGDRIVLEDLNDTATAGSLTVRDLAGGQVAQDLGIAKSVTADAGEALALILGDDVIDLVDSTLLSRLNDGNGVGRAVAGTDFTIIRDGGGTFDISLTATIGDATHLNVLNSGNGVRLGVIRITDRNGNQADVDLSGAVNLGDVLAAIEDQSSAAGLDIDTTYFNSSSRHGLQLSDGSGGDKTFKIEDLSGFAAQDLGIATETAEGEGSIVGNGIHRIASIGDVMRAIQYAYDADAGQYNNGRIRAEFSDNGNGLRLGGSGFPPDFEVVATEGSSAAADLGIAGVYAGGAPPAGAGRDLIAGLDTVLLRSLNGGAGVGLGTISINGVNVDLSGPSAVQTVQDVVERINEQTAATGVVALVNEVGNGLVLTHESGGTITVADVSGTAAADLNLTATDATEPVDSGNLQLQYISRQTLLSTINGGRGLRTGQFNIVDSSGATYVINVTDTQKTIGDVVDLINALGNQLTASINATGDGMLITDNVGGDETLTIKDRSGDFTASDLGIAGSAEVGETFIDGSFEIRIDIDADDTLEDVAAKINNAGGDFSAAVINDGTSVAPHRLTINSLRSGLGGRMIFDGRDTGLTMETMVQARDAVVFLGGVAAENPVLLRPSTNTLSNVLNDVTIDLVGISDEPVELSITQDLDQITQSLSAFVDAYNDVQDRIDQQTSFNAETFERGILFGDVTVSTIENRLYRGVSRVFREASPALSRLFDVGIALGTGGVLSFDENKFREVYAANPEAVERLFNAEETGFGDVFEELLEELTRSFDGLLARKDSALESQEDLLTDRIEAMQDLLDRKQARLERQFQALESSLAGLQGQQAALAGLQTGLFGR
ncbi:MAG: flagellar filament capping protein FliD, partial [Planctomycetes bacterium]|nr:flagellar filament capping protein FliD [Planctomycetota bacterium]